MAIYTNTALAEELFGDLWVKLINETEFGTKLKALGVSMTFYVNDPDVVMYIDSNGPKFGDDASAQKPTVVMKMSGNTVHNFWLNRVNIPKAIATRKIKAKGPVGKVMQILPLLSSGRDLYPEYCQKYGVPLN